MLLLILLMQGCLSVNLPVCTSLSKGNPSTLPGIGKKLFLVCEERNIKITVLSSTITQFEGSRKQIKWLQQNYPILLCDFNQDAVIMDEQVYTTCMANAKKWIAIVQGPNPEKLMLASTHYASVCVQNHNSQH